MYMYCMSCTHVHTHTPISCMYSTCAYDHTYSTSYLPSPAMGVKYHSPPGCARNGVHWTIPIWNVYTHMCTQWSICMLGFFLSPPMFNLHFPPLFLQPLLPCCVFPFSLSSSSTPPSPAHLPSSFLLPPSLLLRTCMRR